MSEFRRGSSSKALEGLEQGAGQTMTTTDILLPGWTTLALFQRSLPLFFLPQIGSSPFFLSELLDNSPQEASF